MESVFVSYSHKDSKLVDRLVADLRYSSIPATYDKWILRVGDSIIEKIASSVLNAGSVVAVLSTASVQSHWVKKELSLGMTSELEAKDVKVLPAVIQDCDIPPILMDKVYADFRSDYYSGLRQLIEALDPVAHSKYEAYFGRRAATEEWCAQLEVALSSCDLSQVRKWIDGNPQALLRLLGRLWLTSEAIPNFSFGRGREFVDYLIINGQSYSFEFEAVRFGPPNWAGASQEQLLEAAARLKDFVSDCRRNGKEFRRAASIRFHEDQVAPSSMFERPFGGHRRYSTASMFKGSIEDHCRYSIGGLILVGRRHEYGDKENRLRGEIDKLTDGAVKVASYDRLLEAMKKGDRD